MNRFLVAQIGPRRSYVVPHVLERAGMLEAFYTDICANHSMGKLLCQFGDGLDLGFIRRLKGRQIPPGVLPKTRSFAWPALLYECMRRMPGSDPFRQAAALSIFGKNMGQAMARADFGNATHLYTMLGDVTPLLEAAVSQGVTTVTEIYIILTAEHIIARERQCFPGFETDPPKQIIDKAFKWLKRVVALSDWFIVPSVAVREDLVENFGVSAERCLLVPYAASDPWVQRRE